MKSQEKVKRQRRIKSIPPYCDNPNSLETLNFLRMLKFGLIKKTQPIRVDHSQKRHMIKRINRTSN